MGYTEDLNEKLIGWKTCFANLKSSLNFISTANHITCYHTGAISFIFFWKYLLPPPSYGKLVDSTLLQVLWQPWVPPCSIFNNHAMTSYIPHIKKNKWWVCHAGVISRVDASLPRLRHCRDGKKKKPRLISQSFKLLLDLKVDIQRGNRFTVEHCRCFGNDLWDYTYVSIIRY